MFNDSYDSYEAYRDNVVSPILEREDDRRYDDYQDKLADAEEVQKDLNRGTQKVTLSINDIN